VEFVGQTAAGLGNQVGGQGRATEEAVWANVILCRPFGDSILFPSSTRHLSAGVWIVPSLGDPRQAGAGWLRCFDRLVWSWAVLKLFNLNGQSELAKKLIWTSAACRAAQSGVLPQLYGVFAGEVRNLSTLLLSTRDTPVSTKAGMGDDASEP